MYKIKESIVTIDAKETKSYGIAYDGGEITDISVDKLRVEELVELINRAGVSTIHIEEVVEDFLSE